MFVAAAHDDLGTGPGGAIYRVNLVKPSALFWVKANLGIFILKGLLKETDKLNISNPFKGLLNWVKEKNLVCFLF